MLNYEIKIFTGRANPILAHEIASYLGVDAASIRERFRKQEAVKRTERPTANPLAMISDSERTLLKGIFDDAALRQVVLFHYPHSARQIDRKCPELLAALRQ